MDTSDPTISFDEEGICSHCNNFYKNTLPAWKNFLFDKDSLPNLKTILKIDLQIGVNMIALLD